MWLDIWNTVKHRTVCVYHISGYQPLQSLGNDEADTLARVRWIENSPSENIARWLHQKLQHAGHKTMWATLLRIHQVRPLIGNENNLLFPAPENLDPGTHRIKWPWKVQVGPKWCGLLAPWGRLLELGG